LKVYTVVHIHFTGQGIGKETATGTTRIIKQDSDWQDLPQNPIVIVTATTPEMLPNLVQTKGIIAEQPGLTSHAALISRELGIPTILDVHGATHLFQNGQTVTMDCKTGKITVGKQVDETDPDIS
jgi:phosphohistidine swiveling domain-containing protein